MIIDEGTFQETESGIGFQDPILFPGYHEKYSKAVETTGLEEAVVTGRGSIMGIDVMISVMDSRFMMSSMGMAVGEKITRLFEAAAVEKKPVIIFTASGGARMQEGIVSLMQMAKTAAAVAKYSEQGGLYISVLTNPTTGGVSASFAFLGDIIIAEPGALIGFAGKRVIEQTIRETLPDNYQTAEYLLKHGFIDTIVERRDLKDILHQLLCFHQKFDRRACNVSI
jgi:acetyl-CoA carboxylase carboxyl transferase subunit beta